MIELGKTGLEALSIELLDDVILVKTSGKPEYIRVIGQQIAWLSAACRFSDSGPRYADTIWKRTTEGSCKHIYEITTQIADIEKDEEHLCWLSLVGDSVIISGFPIARRDSDNKGLQIPIEIMAGLGGVSFAMDAGLGFLLKGHTSVFVPVGRSKGNVQWHLINDVEDGYSYARLAKKGIKLDEKALYTTTSFLGWTKKILNKAGK